MKRLRLLWLALIVAMSLSLAACGGGGGGSDGDGGGGGGGVAGTDFEVSTLAPLDGGSFSAGVAINATGVAVGYADDGGTIKGVKWNVTDPSVAEPLNPLDDDDTRYSAAYGVNAGGLAVGESENDTGIVAVFWPVSTTTPTALTTTGLPAGNSSAHAINSDNEIVGQAGAVDGVAVYWLDDTAAPLVLRNLSSLPGAFSAAYYINDAGFVVGESRNDAGEPQAVVWTPAPGGAFEAGQAPLPLAAITDQVASVAFGVDLSGNIVGEAELTGGEVRGVVWNPDGTVKNILSVATSAQAINDTARIVGYADANSGSDTATIWNAGNIADSRSLTGASFSQAYALNDSQQVVGIAGDQAFVAVPAAP